MQADSKLLRLSQKLKAGTYVIPEPVLNNYKIVPWTPVHCFSTALAMKKIL